MTQPAERTAAMLQTRQFLQHLSIARVPRVPRAVREEARALLRHYPCIADIEMAHSRAPNWFGPIPQVITKNGRLFE